MAEIEFSIFFRSCLTQLLPDEESLCREVQALEKERNEAQARIKWGFGILNVRTKFHRLYPIKSYLDQVLVDCISGRITGMRKFTALLLCAVACLLATSLIACLPQPVQPSARDQSGPALQAEPYPTIRPTIAPTPSYRVGDVFLHRRLTPTPLAMPVPGDPIPVEVTSPTAEDSRSLGTLRLPTPTPRPVTPTPDISSPTPPPGVNRQNWEALVAFFRATGGPQWKNRENWLSDQHIATWHGVESSGGQVTAIRLSENGLTGELPPQLGNLYALGVLNLYGNNLSGAIPPELGNLVRMQTLVIGGNQLTGCIPAGLKTNMRKLDGRIYLAGLDYCPDTRTAEEQEAHKFSAHILTDQEFGPIARGLPWIADGITWREGSALNLFYSLFENDLPLAEFLAGSSFFSGEYSRLLKDFLDTLKYLREKDSSLYQQIVNAPWFRDDLTVTEAVATTYATRDLIEDILSGVEPGTAVRDFNPLDHASTKTLNIASGQVNLSIVRPVSMAAADDEIFALMSQGIQTLEEVLQTPWRNKTVVLVMVPEGDEISTTGGSHLGSHMVSYRSPDDPLFKEIIYHELAHYFFDGFPLWLNEGGPEFFKSYALQMNHAESLSERRRIAETGASTCAANGVGNIQEWKDTPDSFGGLGWLPKCPYHLGELYLMEIHRELGSDTLGSSLQELVALADSNAANAANEEAIYRTFMENTPFGQRETFRQIHRRIHGGAPPGWQPSGRVSTAPDTAALVALYNATGGANWKLKRYWMTDLPLELWRGVNTDANGLVTSINLRFNDLSGPIPKEVARLTELQDLSLPSNGLTGSIPAALGQLTELQELRLSSNELTGAIPAELGNLSKLRTLNLDGNRLTGPIPPELANLTNLITLWLGGQGNSFTGCIPAALQQIRNHDLDRLGLPYCREG